MFVRLAQLMPRPRDVPANLARVRELLAASGDADLLVLPELFLSGYEQLRHGLYAEPARRDG